MELVAGVDRDLHRRPGRPALADARPAARGGPRRRRLRDARAAPGRRGAVAGLHPRPVRDLPARAGHQRRARAGGVAAAIGGRGRGPRRLRDGDVPPPPWARGDRARPAAERRGRSRDRRRAGLRRSRHVPRGRRLRGGPRRGRRRGLRLQPDPPPAGGARPRAVPDGAHGAAAGRGARDRRHGPARASGEVHPQGAISSLLFYAWSHSRNFSPSEVRGWLDEAGFTDVDVHRNVRSPFRMVVTAR